MRLLCILAAIALLGCEQHDGTMVINSCTSTDGVSHPLLNTPITYSVTGALLTFKVTGAADDVWTAI